MTNRHHPTPPLTNSLVDVHAVAVAQRVPSAPISAARVPIQPLLMQYTHLGASASLPNRPAPCASSCRRCFAPYTPARWLDLFSEDYNLELYRLLESLNAAQASRFENTAHANPRQHLDALLEQLYEWGASNRVWLW